MFGMKKICSGGLPGRFAHCLMAGLLLLIPCQEARGQAPTGQGEESGAEAQNASPAAQYQEGIHYARLPVPVETEHPDRIELVEAFSYACIHCYRLDPALEEWVGKLPEDVAFLRVPAIFNPTWAQLARLFYAAEDLGVQEQVHGPIFDALHLRGVDLRKPELAAELFQREAGVAPEDLRKTLESFGLHNRLRQADAKGRAYRLTGVPTLIVNGKYRIETEMANNQATMLKIADFLIAQERALAQSPN